MQTCYIRGTVYVTIRRAGLYTELKHNSVPTAFIKTRVVSLHTFNVDNGLSWTIYIERYSDFPSESNLWVCWRTKYSPTIEIELESAEF